MGNRVRVEGVKRQQIDDEKLALAFILLARVLHDERWHHAPAPLSDREAAS